MKSIAYQSLCKPWAKFFAAALLISQVGCGGGGNDQSTPPPRESPTLPTDPLLKYQWHLKNTGQAGAPDSALHGIAGVDLNVWPVWEQGVFGKGVTVAVVEHSGVQVDHEDLKPNIAQSLNYNFETGGTDVNPPSRDKGHGTAVAGIIAAAMNDIGGVGVAPQAQLAIYKSPKTASAEHLQHALSYGAANGSIAVSNSSWGLPASGSLALTGFDADVRAAVEYGVDHGWNGKGIVYVAAAGNDFYNFKSADPDKMPGYMLANFELMRQPEWFMICAINARGQHPFYSNAGSNLLACAPSSGLNRSSSPGITTTIPFNQYTHQFGDTSAATPMVSGLVALIRSFRKDLTWRDLRLIIMRTARQFDGMKDNDKTDERMKWFTTKGINPRTGKPYQYNVLYGFGAVDAAAAIEYAKDFESVGGSSETWRENACVGNVESTQLTTQVPIACGDRKIEFLEAEIGLNHPRFRDLAIVLVSPSGTKVPLTESHPECGIEPDYTCPTSDFGNVYRTSVTALLDEPASGNWSVHVIDRKNRYRQNFVKGVKLTVR